MGRRPWQLSERELTPEGVYFARRRFLKVLGLGGLTALGLARLGRRELEARQPLRPTDPELTLRYNNFYEFTRAKPQVWRLARDFRLDPYGLAIDGLVDRPGTLSLEQVEALGLEERVYRFRCVERWGMVVPWRGVPLRTLLAHVGVRPEARYLALRSFLDPEQAPGQRDSWLPWPYFEALRLDEALNELSLVATGIYGRPLPPQSGAPLRVVLPWKYGFKGPKSVVRLTLTRERPPTFWNSLHPAEYGWTSNVDPDTPHPRYSQAWTRYLGEAGERPTLPFNGYGEQVAHLYLS